MHLIIYNILSSKFAFVHGTISPKQEREINYQTQLTLYQKGCFSNLSDLTLTSSFLMPAEYSHGLQNPCGCQQLLIEAWDTPSSLKP